MPHVVTQSCCNDASCVYACPVNCIHPTPDEPDFATAEMLYIDPMSCVDCGACVRACPTGAITRDTKLDGDRRVFLDINAGFYAEPRRHPVLARPIPAPKVQENKGMLRVAIVGSGPAAMYAAEELLTTPTGAAHRVSVDMYERRDAPYGLVRFGVAPDHVETKGVARVFDLVRAMDGFTLHTNTEIGDGITDITDTTDMTHEQLQSRYDAVIYAVGAATARTLDVPGADLPGVASATDFVAWYNGHPDQRAAGFDLSGRRAIVIGNGNVALDVARILTCDPDRLCGTTIAPRALEVLRHSKIEEVVIVGRRGVAQSAFTVGEFSGLLTSDCDIVVDVAEPVGPVDYQTSRKLRLMRQSAAIGERKRIVFRYQLSPVAIGGADRVARVDFARTALRIDDAGVVRAEVTDETEHLDAGLVLTCIGYHGVPVPGLPFDDVAGVVPNEHGRVRPGVYVAGWIKRGPSGYIGTNKSCALETVRTLIDDFNAR